MSGELQTIGAGNGPVSLVNPPGYTILSLDLGAKLGWCIGRGGKIEVSGTKDFYRAGVHPGWKFAAFQDWLAQFHRVNEIFYENVMFNTSNKQGRIYDGFLAFLQAFAQRAGIQLTAIPPATVKKIFAGHGHAEKVDMCARGHALGWKGGIVGTDDSNDELDACAIYYAVMQKRGIDVTFL